MKLLKTKVCTKCGADKPLEEYHADKRLKDGKRSNCKTCNIAVGIAWSKANPEKARARWARWAASPKGREYQREYYQQNRDWKLLQRRLNHEVLGGRR